MAVLKKIDTKKLKDTFNSRVLSNKKLLIYLLFVVLSTIFWFLNTLSKTYTTDINYPVEFVNMPTNKVLVNKLPNQLILRVNAYGFDILRYKFRAIFSSNSFDVEQYTNQRINKKNISEYILSTSTIKGKVANNLASDINLLQISPDTIVFRFSPMASKKVPVKLNAKLAYRKQFKTNGAVLLQPDSVWVKGPQLKLDSITCAETVMLDLSDLHKNINSDIEIKRRGGVTFVPEKIAYNVPVVRFTESSTEVKVGVENLPDSLLLRLFPDEIKVSYFVGMKQYSSIVPELFDVVVDYKNAVNNKSNKLKVNLKRYPQTVSNIRIYPETVSYLIEKKQ